MDNNKAKSPVQSTKLPQASNYLADLLNNLLVRLLESVKADRAVLVGQKQERIEIEADVGYDEKKGAFAKTAFQLHSDRKNNKLIPISLIKKVLSDRQQVILEQPQEFPGFTKETYFKNRAPGFIFCTAIPSSGQISRVLYLESGSPSDLCEEEAQRLLKVWIDQVEVSLENAHRFSRLQEDLTDRLQEISAVKKKNRASIQFLADMNHEARDPLNSIVGFSQLLMKKGSQLHLPAEVKRYLENIEASGTRLAELLDNVLEYSRLETARAELVKEDIDFRLLMNSVYLANRQLLDKRSIQLKIELASNFPGSIYSARSALTKILMTLIKFCILRSPPGKSIFFSGIAHKKELTLSITDNGDRISSESRQNLFAPFVFLKNYTSPATEGANFDLAIAKQLVDRLQGSLEYQAKRDQLSQIVLKLPRTIQESPPKSSIMWKPKTTYDQDSIVFLLDGGHCSWELLESMLRDLEVTYEKAAVTPDNLLRLEEIKPQMIFFDLQRTGFDEKTKQLMQSLKKIPVLKNSSLVALTTNKFNDQIPADDRMPEISVLIKPFGLSDLVSLLNNKLNTKKSGPDKQSDHDDGQIQHNHAQIMSLGNDAVHVNQLLVEALQELVTIPIYKGGTLISQIKKIKENRELASGVDPKLLSSLKSAVFEGNAERFQGIIKRAIEGK